jgi:hypothetical protein
MIQNLPKVDCEKAVYERRDLKDRRGFLIWVKRNARVAPDY